MADKPRWSDSPCIPWHGFAGQPRFSPSRSIAHGNNGDRKALHTNLFICTCTCLSSSSSLHYFALQSNASRCWPTPKYSIQTSHRSSLLSTMTLRACSWQRNSASWACRQSRSSNRHQQRTEALRVNALPYARAGATARTIGSGRGG